MGGWGGVHPLMIYKGFLTNPPNVHKGNRAIIDGAWEEVCIAAEFTDIQQTSYPLLPSQRKMLHLSTGVLLLLLPWFGGLVLGELSHNFSQCLDFFYNSIPPTGFSANGYQPICQRYKNEYRFATLYYRCHRAPLFSAYKLHPANGKRPRNLWMYEPQVKENVV